ncbi:MAG: helicase, partial [Rhizobiales bacterium]|nr:helicase [Hyphomicrobiales bacterium]
GQLSGFRFQPDPTAEGIDAKAVRSAADKILADAISKKAAKAAQSPNEDFTLGSDQSLRWRGEVVARVIAGTELLKPRMLLLSDEQLNGAPRDQIQERLDLWLETHIKTLLKPLFDLKDAENLSGTARGLAFRLSEAYGIVARQEVSEDVRALDQETRAGLRQLGIRFGAFHIFVPQLLKPAPSKLLVDLFVLFSDKGEIAGHAEIPALSAAGRTSVPVDAAFEPQLYALVGFKICGKRAVRIDILERLADIIRPIMSWKPEAPGDKPDGAVIGHGFSVTVDMTSLLGCAGDDFSEVLKALNYRMERKLVEAPEPEAAAVDDAAASAEPDEQASQEAKAPDEAVVGEAVTGEAVADEPAAGETETAEDTPIEPQFVEIWRPQGRGGGRKGAPRRASNQGKSDQNNNQDRKSQENQQQRPSKGKGKRNNKNRNANNNQNSRPAHRSRPVDKPIDPDSPFAALAALKNDLSKK